MQSLMETIDIT